MHSASGEKARRHEGTKARRAARAPCPFLPLLALHLAVLAALPALAEPPAPPDAVIQLWEQRWTLHDDGSSVYHVKQHVQLNNERAYGEFADPRITYHVDTDQLEIIAARVKRPDGTYRELPDYGRVEASPEGSAGWPAFAGIRQKVLILSGVEPGCVAELEYKITSQPSSKPFLAADVRLDHRYPIVQRTIAVRTPKNVPVRWACTGWPASAGKPPGNVESFTLKNLPAVPDEPQAPPWQTRCARVAFTTVGSVEAWLRAELDAIDAGAVESDLIVKLVREWTKDVFEPADRLRAIQEKLAGSFNVVEFEPAWRPAAPRPAPEALRSSYGTPEEAAAVLLACARAAGLPTRLGLLVHDDLWTDAAPQKAFVAAYVLLYGDAAPPDLWEARRGRIVRDGSWAGHTLLTFGDNQLVRSPLPPWTDADESRCVLNGTIKLTADGQYTGTMTVRTTGLFVASESLRSTDAQKSRIGALVGRVLPNTSVESFAVKTLAPGSFEATAQIKSSKPLKKLEQRFCVQLPLARRERSTPVRLAGPFEERVELTVEWPAGWKADAAPAELTAAGAEDGSVEQRITSGENRLTLTRTIRLAGREIAPERFARLRDSINTLRSEAWRTLVLQP